MKLCLIASAFTILFIGSCRNDPGQGKNLTKPDKNEMAELNRFLVQKDREVIQNYIERKGLNMTESPTGLWFFIKREGEGDFLKSNDKIVMDFECSFIDGTVCYSSANIGPKELVLGKTAIEPGLNEGLRFLKRGGEAIFILPPYLAFGLVGDGKKIPPRMTLVYNVSIRDGSKN